MTQTAGVETTASVSKSPALVRGFSRLIEEGAVSRSLYLSPLGGLPAGGSPLPAFEVLLRLIDDKGSERVVLCHVGRENLLAWAKEEGEEVTYAVKRRLAALEFRRPPFAGLPMDRPQVMGIVNATPDSFSDGGKHYAPDDAVMAGMAMIEAGASILDVGGESTRPGADPVDPAEELRRVLPVIRGLCERGAKVSIDTRHAQVMAAAVDAGAAIINDVTALQGDADSLAVAAKLNVPVVLMHMRGDPRSMQEQPVYRFAPLDVFDALEQRVEACLAAGISRRNLAVDVGIGFAKSVNHNAQILNRLALYHGIGCAQLLGVSRKSYIGRLSKGEPPADRLPGSLATAVMGASQGVQIVRVHDVAETVQALTVWRALSQAVVPPDFDEDCS
jgi:dihydropteroate synthase